MNKPKKLGDSQFWKHLMGVKDDFLNLEKLQIQSGNKLRIGDGGLTFLHFKWMVL